MKVSWFSTGVSSAVATKLAVDTIDEIIYIHIDDQHPDTLRFVKDCEIWFGRQITVLQSPYKCVESAILAAGGRGYINGPRGASCSMWLKKRVRKEWELEYDRTRLVYVWGFDVDETRRSNRLIDTIHSHSHQFPLIENNLTKQEAHKMLMASGIKRPTMYELGYHNNNCIGCVKGGMGYWNKIRIDFPDVFNQRALLERRVGASCINGVFLDELEPNRGRHKAPICDECGIMCEIMSQRLEAVDTNVPVTEQRKGQKPFFPI